MAEVAKAYVTLIPTMQGIKNAVLKDLNGASPAIGGAMGAQGRRGGRLFGGGLMARMAPVVKAGAAAAGAAVVAGVVTAVKSGGALEQSMGAIDAVFKNSAGQMHAWSKQAAGAVGLTRNEYNELGTLLGAQLKNGGTAMDQLGKKTNDLVGLGADLASMFGGDTRQAVEAISSALKGERDPIERYGVTLRQSTIDAKAAAMGFKKVKGSLSSEATQAATLALIMEQTTDAHGNFAKEATTYEGKVQRLKASIGSWVSELGMKFLPIATTVVGWVGDNLIPALNRVQGALVAIWPKVQGAFAPLVGWVQTVLWPLLVSLWDSLKAAWDTVGGPVTEAVKLSFNAMMATVAIIWGLLKAVVEGALKAIKGAIDTVMGVLRGDWASAWNGIKNIFAGVWQAIAGVFSAALSSLKNQFAAWAGYVRVVVSAVWQAIKNIFTSAFTGLASIVARGWANVLAFFQAIPARIKSVFASAGSWLVSAGGDIVSGLLKGIGSLAGRIGSWFLDKIPSWIKVPFKLALGIRSPSRVFEKYGRYTLQGYVRGVAGQGATVGRVMGAAAQNITRAFNPSLHTPRLAALTRPPVHAPTLTPAPQGAPWHDAPMTLEGRLEIGGDGLARIIDGRVNWALAGQARDLAGRRK